MEILSQRALRLIRAVEPADAANAVVDALRAAKNSGETASILAEAAAAGLYPWIVAILARIAPGDRLLRALGIADRNLPRFGDVGRASVEWRTEGSIFEGETIVLNDAKNFELAGIQVIRAPLLAKRTENLLLPDLRECADLDVTESRNFEVPKLTSVGNLHGWNARGLSIPMLEDAADLTIGGGSISSDLRRLRRVQTLRAEDVDNLHLESLVEASALVLLRSKNVKIPALREAGNLFVGWTHGLEMPRLSTCSRLSLSYSRDAAFPELAHAGRVDWKGAKRVRVSDAFAAAHSIPDSVRA